MQSTCVWSFKFISDSESVVFSNDVLLDVEKCFFLIDTRV